MQNISNDAEASAKSLSGICVDLVFSIVSAFSAVFTDPDLYSFPVPVGRNFKQVVGLWFLYRLGFALADYSERKY